MLLLRNSYANAKKQVIDLTYQRCDQENVIEQFGAGIAGWRPLRGAGTGAAVCQAVSGSAAAGRRTEVVYHSSRKIGYDIFQITSQNNTPYALPKTENPKRSHGYNLVLLLQ